MAQYQGNVHSSPTWQDLTNLNSDLIIGVFSGLESTSPFWKEEFKSNIFDFKASEKELFILYNIQGVHRVLFVGLGEKSSFNSEKARVASAVAIKYLRDKGSKSIVITPLNNLAQETAEGIVLGLYKFDELKTEIGTPSKKEEKRINTVTCICSSDAQLSEWKSGVIISESQNFSRRIAELPANVCTPRFIVAEVVKMFSGITNTEVIAHDSKWAEEMKMGSFLSVTHGSDEPAQFLEIHYKGNKDKQQKPFIFVGKGITFDSGGISIKPAEGMGTMRGDCGGAAAVIGILRAISSLQLNVNVIGLCPLTENMPSGKATKPSDVVYAMNGKTIEIDNTDAEGRLILADALTYSETFNPHTVIDIATLTGAIGIALGIHYTGAFTAHDDLWKKIELAGNHANELYWRMPLSTLYRKQMASDLADIKNVGGRHGGACTAAIFLSEFINNHPNSDIKWIHLDIAGTALPNARDSPYVPSGMTGVPVRSLVQFVRNSLS